MVSDLKGTRVIVAASLARETHAYLIAANVQHV